MSEDYYPVKHELFIARYAKPFGSNGTWEETWYWDVYSVVRKDSAKIRCTCTSGGRNVVIPWFESEEVDIGEVAKAACLKEMERNIK